MEHFFKSSLLLCMFLMLSPSCLGLGSTSSPKNIFILGGQSNMAGRGGVYNNSPDVFLWNRYIPPESRPNLSVLKFNVNNVWVGAQEPLDKDIDAKKTNGVSCGMAFGNELLTKTGPRAGVIGLVPTAIGGTLITNWTKTADPTQSHYANLVARIKASESKGGIVRALFWLQGESDASSVNASAAYEERLKNFFTNLRIDLSPRFLPIIMVKIASIDRYVPFTDNMEVVRAAQEAVSKELPDVKIIDGMDYAKPDGTGFNKDHVHMNTKTQISIGKMLAYTYLSHYPNLL